jgi:hypothetical protein
MIFYSYAYGGVGLYFQIERTHQQKLGQYNWFIRRASHALGSYMRVIKSDSSDSLQIGRQPNQKNKNSIAAAVLLEYLHPFSLVSLRVRCGQGFLSPEREVLLDLIPVEDGFKLSDPFLLGSAIGKAITYRIRLTECWKKITIKPIAMTGRVVCRIRIPYDIDIAPRYADFIEVDSLNTHDSIENNDLYKLIQPNEVQEIIFPDVRYICNQPSNRLVVTFASINFPSGKYSTYSTFDGISASRLIVNDCDAQWYHNGVSGLGGDINEVTNSLQFILRRLDIQYSTFYGMSMGGYGAILFGCLLEVDRIVAINPEVILFTKASRSDQHVLSKNDHPYKDIIGFLSLYKKNLHVLFSNTDPIDKKMLSLVKEINKATCYSVNGNHNMSQYMHHYLWLVSLIESGECDIAGIEAID